MPNTIVWDLPECPQCKQLMRDAWHIQRNENLWMCRTCGMTQLVYREQGITMQKPSSKIFFVDEDGGIFEEDGKPLFMPGPGCTHLEGAIKSKMVSTKVRMLDDGYAIDGCCGGGCYVITGITFCPFCGERLVNVPEPAP